MLRYFTCNAVRNEGHATINDRVRHNDQTNYRNVLWRGFEMSKGHRDSIDEPAT